MATSKTLTPTNVTIQIPAFTDKPDQRVNSNCIDKEADAINALSDQMASLVEVQNLDISGFTFDGTMREIRPQITLKSGYKPYIINLIPSHYDLHHYPDYWSDVDSSGKFYVEENLPSNLVSLRAVILWIKDS